VVLLFNNVKKGSEKVVQYGCMNLSKRKRERRERRSRKEHKSMLDGEGGGGNVGLITLTDFSPSVNTGRQWRKGGH
jgi:hypothetical protein